MDGGGERDLVFVSYSRDDAEWAQAFTTFLKPLVRAQRLRMWVDTANLRAGERWHAGIADAISRTEVALLLVSSRFLASDYIMETELPALVEQGVTLAPVLVGDCLWPHVPELAQVQWLHDPVRDGALSLVADRAGERDRRLVGICDALIDLLPAVTRSGVEAPPVDGPAFGAPPVAVPAGPVVGALSGVPELPPGYIVRDELARLVAAVVSLDEGPVGVTGDGGALGLHGRGGIGKSVLAAALARDDDVRRRFPDGVFWVTAGETPDVLALQLDLLARLGAPGSTARTIAAAATELRALLADRRVLLVVDDVWTADATSAFEVIGPRGRLVRTTRDPGLAGPRARRVDVLTAAEAGELATRVLGAPVPAAAERAFALVGHVPLAVALLAAAVRGGRTWEQLTADLDAGVEVFGSHPYANAFAAMRAAVGGLPAETSEALFSLAVFPPDTRIPAAAIARYWSSRGADASATIDRLAAANLLQRDGDTVAFHDLQHDYLMLHAPALTGLHVALLSAYRLLLAPTSGWWRLPVDEPYAWEHLVEHLLGAGEHEEAVATVTDPAYLAQRISGGGTHAAESDLASVPGNADVGWWRDWIARHAHLLQPRAGADTLVPATLHAWLAVDPTAAERGIDPDRLEPLLPSPRLRVRWGLEPATPALIRVIESGNPRSVAWSPDGTRMAVGSAGGIVRVWEVGTGRLVATWREHGGTVEAVAWSPDGHRLASGDRNGTLLISEATSGAVVIRVRDATGVVERLVWSPDGTMLAGGGKGARIWDPRSGAHLTTFSGHPSRIQSLAWAPDSTRIASGSIDTTLVWDARSGEGLASVAGGLATYGHVTWSPDGAHIAVNLHNGVAVWELASRAVVRRIATPGDYFIGRVAWSPDGACLAIADQFSGSVTLVDAHSGQQLGELPATSRGQSDMAWSRDGMRLATVTYDDVRVWSPVAVETSRGRTTGGHPRGAGAVAWSPDASRLASSGTGIDSTVLVWEPTTGTVTARLTGDGYVSALLWCPAADQLAVGIGGKAIAIWDVAAQAQTAQFETVSSTFQAWSPDDRWMAVVDQTLSTIRLLRPDGRQLGTLDTGFLSIAAAEPSPDGGRLAVIDGHSGRVSLWSARDCKRLVEIETGHDPHADPIAWRPDGTELATTAWGGTVRRWDAATGSLVRTYPAPTYWPTALAYSPDAARIAVAGRDGLITVLDLPSGRPIAQVRLDAVADLAWSRAGIAVAGVGGVVVLDLR